MRVITGAHKSTSVDHLLAETELLPVSEHLGLICKQFLASVSHRSHPNHATVQQQTGVCKGRKKMVHTLQSQFGDTVRPFLTDGVLPEISYKKTIDAIHFKFVAENKSKLVNKVLGVAPPEIHPSETSFLRRSRTTLCQLRSGECNKLKNYQVKIGTANNDICSACRGATYTSEHLFNCTSSPTVRLLPSFAPSHLSLTSLLTHSRPRPPPEPLPLARGGPD
jgi:hypothetical protein